MPSLDSFFADLSNKENVFTNYEIESKIKKARSKIFLGFSRAYLLEKYYMLCHNYIPEDRNGKNKN